MMLLREMNDVTHKDCFKNVIGTQQICAIAIIMLLLSDKTVTPRAVVRLGVRGLRREELGKVNLEIDVSNPQAKTAVHGDAKLCLDKIKHSIINCYTKS